jgi:hypothetical protein
MTDQRGQLNFYLLPEFRVEPPFYPPGAIGFAAGTLYEYIAELHVELGVLVQQPLQLMVTVNLEEGRIDAIGGDDLGYRLAFYPAGKRPARSMSALALAGAVTGGLAALAIALDERSGTELLDLRIRAIPLAQSAQPANCSRRSTITCGGLA